MRRKMLMAIMGIGVLTGIGICIFARKSRPSAEAVAEYTVEQLSAYSMDQTMGMLTDVPKSIWDLDGRKIAIVGRCYEPNLDKSDCKLIPSRHLTDHDPPLAQWFIPFRIPDQNAEDFNLEKIRVVGLLHVSIQHDVTTGVIKSVLQLDTSEVSRVAESK